MPQDISPDIEREIKRWLEQWGFMENPFATVDAERETFLPNVFVDTGKLEWILGDPENSRTILFFALRGCGKTAHRRMVEEYTCPRAPDREVLAVNYNEFSFWRQFEKPPMPEDNLPVILRNGIEALVETVMSPGTDLQELMPESYCELKQLCEEFAPELLHPVKFLRHLRRATQGSGVQLTMEEVIEWCNEGSLHKVMEKAPDSSSNQALQFLVGLCDAPPTNYDLRQRSCLPAVDILVQQTLQLGLKSVYVLVDSVDEIILPEHLTWVDCLQSLLSNLQLMTMNNLAFKFFLPANMMAELLSKPWVRSDKLAYAELSWSHENLQELLSERLQVFNRSGVNSLKMMCEPRLGKIIDRDIIERARGIPRTLVQLGHQLLAVHCRQQPIGDLIRYEEWAQAVQEVKIDTFQDVEAMVPVLLIGPHSVRLSNRVIDLTPNEMRFLQCLAENGGASSKETLVDYIYDTSQGVTDQALSSLVKRLREKIGDDARSPRYLQTQHGQGFILKYWETRKED